MGSLILQPFTNNGGLNFTALYQQWGRHHLKNSRAGRLTRNKQIILIFIKKNSRVCSGWKIDPITTMLVLIYSILEFRTIRLGHALHYFWYILANSRKWKVIFDIIHQLLFFKEKIMSKHIKDNFCYFLNYHLHIYSLNKLKFKARCIILKRLYQHFWHTFTRLSLSDSQN